MVAEYQKESPEISQEIVDIINGIDSGNTIFFCGAGISRDSGLPVVNQLVPYILDKLEVPENDKKIILDEINNPRIPFEAFIEVLRENSDVNKILDIYKQGEPNSNHILLAKLIKAGKLKTIVTTNFDKLIERALALDPEPWHEGEDYTVIYLEEDYEKIYWEDGRVKIIKIHGSVDDTQRMAMTLKQVASQKLSRPRMSVIKHIFSSGNNERVLILGYSSSDVFDLSPQIQSIDEKFKKIYYVQHSDIHKTEEIEAQQNHNPFKRFRDGKRIFLKTSTLIQEIWEKLLTKGSQNFKSNLKVNWKNNVDEWYYAVRKQYGESFKHLLLVDIYLKLGMLDKAKITCEDGLKVLKPKQKNNYKPILTTKLGTIFYNKGDYENALSKYNYSLRKAKEQNNIFAVGSLFQNLGSVYKFLGNYRLAESYCQKSIEIAKGIKNPDMAGQSVFNLGDVYFFMQDYKKAILHFKRSFHIAEDYGNKKLSSACLGSIGNAYVALKNYEKAGKYYFHAIEMSKFLGDIKHMGVWLGNLGITNSKMGVLKKAFECFNLALSIAIDIGDKHNASLWNGEIGNMYLIVKDYNKATEYFTNALQYAEDNNDDRLIGVWRGSLGIASKNNGEIDAALKYFLQALELSIKVKDLPNRSIWLGHIANIYRELEEYSKSISFYNKAIKIAQDINDSENQIRWLIQLGTTSQSLSLYLESIESFETAMNLAEKINHNQTVSLCLDRLGDAWRNMGDYKKANEYYEKAMQIKV